MSNCICHLAVIEQRKCHQAVKALSTMNGAAGNLEAGLLHQAPGSGTHTLFSNSLDPKSALSFGNKLLLSSQLLSFINASLQGQPPKKNL